MFTGSAAFVGDTPIAVALKQIGEAPRNPHDVEQTVPEHIGRAILRCLEKDPQQRFSSVKELQAALIDDSMTTQKNFPVRPKFSTKFSSIYLVDVLKAVREKRKVLPTTLGLVVLAAILVTAVITYRTTKNKQEPAPLQNAQSIDSGEEWKTFLKNYREEGQLSLAAQERSPQQQTQTVAVNASRPAPLSETAPASAPTDASAPPAKQRPNWTTLFDTVSIRSGVFMMGKEDGKKDAKPRHRVRLDGFQMTRSEITNRQYMTFLEKTGHPRPKDPAFAKNYLMDYPNLPVVNVSYQDALAFCKWASAKFGITVRLPTEAEWEYAALGGKKDLLYPWGFESPSSRARYKENVSRRVQTVERTAFPPNGFGLYNMSGNVSEWVSDFYSKDYYSISPVRNPTGPERGARRVIRGGSWADDETQLACARRASRDPQERSDQLGFRIVLMPSIPPGRP